MFQRRGVLLEMAGLGYQALGLHSNHLDEHSLNKGNHDSGWGFLTSGGCRLHHKDAFVNQVSIEVIGALALKDRMGRRS